MRKAFSLLIVLYALPFILLGQNSNDFDPAGAYYLWPTEASSHLTSTFAETRSEHFHAAIDIKTWGQRGYEVYATRDGIVSRFAIGPRGYGKVVYLKHTDGSYSVYAHLLAFNDRLQQFADSVRFSKDYAFEIERFFGENQMKVKQGDVIGYSGASGIGPPHLHFELRTPSHKPFNPLLTNLEVKDTIAPEFSAIAIEPLSPAATIEGENNIFTRDIWSDNGQYNAGTIDVTGQVGIGVDVFDQSNGVHNAYAVYELSLFVDGKKRFFSRVDSFSYKETGQMFLDRIYPILAERNEGYQRLYIADGNTLPFYSRSLNGNGKLNLEPGTHRITIRASDFFGNTDSASFNLRVRPKEKLLPELPVAEINKLIGFADTQDWYWNNNWVTIPKKQFGKITVAADSSQLISHGNGITIDLTDRTDYFFNIPELGPLNLRRIIPAQRNRILSINQENYAEFPAHTFYDTVSTGMVVTPYSRDSVKVDLLPYNAYPLKKNFRFHVKRESALNDTSGLSFYKLDRYDDNEKWDLIPTTFSERYITGEAGTLGTYVTLRDSVAPKMANPRLRQRPDNRWLVYVDIDDNLSGIEYSKIRFSINGVRGIPEYEPEDDRVAYYHPDFVPSDSMNLKITAYDKMGNRSDTTFTVRNQ